MPIEEFHKETITDVFPLLSVDEQRKIAPSIAEEIVSEMARAESPSEFATGGGFSYPNIRDRFSQVGVRTEVFDEFYNKHRYPWTFFDSDANEETTDNLTLSSIRLMKERELKATLPGEGK